jgi:ATP-binding protein involved in chromosome partitioning
VHRKEGQRANLQRGEKVANRVDPQERARMLEERKRRLSERMGQIKQKFIVLSGKGGVGKSTVAAYLATSLASRGKAVGLVDTDIHGPSIPKMLGLEDERITMVGDTVIPVAVSDNLKVMSIAFLLRSKRDAVIWRGPLKMGMIEEFLANVDWGPLDYLIIDSPPGTGDEPLSVCQLIPGLDGALVVATPQEIAIADVEKSITFCGQLRIPIVGVIENMSGFVCPHCGEEVQVFKSGGAERMAREMGVPFLGRLPMVPEVVDACDAGDCTVGNLKSETLKASLEEITSRIMAAERKQPVVGSESVQEQVSQLQESDKSLHGSTLQPAQAATRIALPVEGAKLSTHFGHSPQFAIFDVKDGEILSETSIEPPPHAPGVLPSWLKEQGVTLVIAGGLGRRAMAAFEGAGIKVVYGAPAEAAHDVVTAYLKGTLVTGGNVCDH